MALWGHVTLKRKIDYSVLRIAYVGLFNRWKPKGKMYSHKCTQCGAGFLSSYDFESPICPTCLQKAKSLDSTINHDKNCMKCGNAGVIYGKDYCHACYFGFNKQK